MSEKKEMNQAQLDKISGGKGLNNVIVMNIGLTFKIDEQGKELYREIQLSFNKKFTIIVSDIEVETECKKWCEQNCCLYVRHTIINSYVLQNNVLIRPSILFIWKMRVRQWTIWLFYFNNLFLIRGKEPICMNTKLEVIRGNADIFLD